MNVKYKSGKILNEVKSKNVEVDHKNGELELIEVAAGKKNYS